MTSQGTEKIVLEAAQLIDAKKGGNILALDVRSLNPIADYFLIAEGNVERHVQAICNEIIDNLAAHNLKPFRVEGQAAGEWIVIDYGFFIVHLMTPSMRHFYQLEQLWKKGRVIDLKGC